MAENRTDRERDSWAVVDIETSLSCQHVGLNIWLAWKLPAVSFLSRQSEVVGKPAGLIPTTRGRLLLSLSGRLAALWTSLVPRRAAASH